MMILMCTKQAARFLGISHRTLENWRQQGIGPDFVRLPPKLVRYRKEDLLAWMNLSVAC
ncbi:MAG: hypothetical protein CME84_02445 [Henriciella sp.]|nr:hypothetical protein [Henriciella sp.]MBF34756.1 hypothetical protein [Hyphomonadaceae bacterium]